MKLTQLAEFVNSDIVIRQYHGQQSRWTCSIDNAETKDNETSGILHGTYGNGTTPRQALLDYCRKISNRFLVVNATSDNKRINLQLGRITL